MPPLPSLPPSERRSSFDPAWKNGRRPSSTASSSLRADSSTKTTGNEMADVLADLTGPHRSAARRARDLTGTPPPFRRHARMHRWDGAQPVAAGLDGRRRLGLVVAIIAGWI